MPLQAFIDDSGNEPTAKVFVLGGYIAPADSWNSFSFQWEEICARHPATPDFKMTGALPPNGPYWRSLPAADRERSRDQRLIELAESIAANVTCGFSVGVVWSVYDAVARGKVPRKIDSPYFFLFWRMLQLVAQWQQKTSRREKVDFIFDDQSKLDSTAVGWHSFFQGGMSEDEKFILTGTPIFRHDSETLPLKAVAMWAWSYRREAVDRLGAGRAPYLRHKFQDVLSGCEHHTASITPESLEKIVKIAGNIS